MLLRLLTGNASLSLRYLAFIVFLINFIFVLISAIIAFMSIAQLGIQYSWLNLFVIWMVLTALCLVASIFMGRPRWRRHLIDTAQNIRTDAISQKRKKEPTSVESPATTEIIDQNLLEKLSKKYLHPGTGFETLDRPQDEAGKNQRTSNKRNRRRKRITPRPKVCFS